MIRPVRADGTIETGGVFVPITRRRVIDRIASAAMQRVVLIVAPAGYGKSVALRQYLDAIEGEHVRYDVLPEHAGLLGFLRGLADAVSTVAPDARVTLPGAYEKNASSSSPGSDLAMWMHSHLKSYRGIIAIDDLHVAQEDREVTRFLSALIDRTKARVQWILASRSTLGLPIGTWLAYGDSDLAIDEHDLKFSADEAREAAKAFRLAVRDEELYELLNLTDGWATAMTFALRSSTRSVDLRNVSSMTRDMIYRYLAEQVYGTLDDDERRFVESVALLREIDVTLLSRAGFDNGVSMVEKLRQRAAFLYEKSPGVFRMHDLFADFAMHQLMKRGVDEARVRALEVGAILESVGRLADALRLYQWSHANSDVIRLIEEHGSEFVAKGFTDDVISSLDALSDAGLPRSPILDGIYGLAQLSRGQFGEGERLLQRALKSELPPLLRGEFLMRLAIHQSNNGTEPVELLEAFLADGDIDPKYRIEAESYLAFSYKRLQRPPDALVEKLQAELQNVGDDETFARVLFRLGCIAFMSADSVESQRLLSRAADVAARCSLWTIVSRAYRWLAARALTMENDTAVALWCAQQASAAATRAGDYHDLQTSLLFILSIETRRGNVDRVIQTERQLVELNKADKTSTSYIIESQAHRSAWGRKFAEAHRMLTTIAGRQAYAEDRAFVYAVLALCLALDGETKKSVAAGEVALSECRSAPVTNALLEFAEIFVALADVANSRFTAATRLLKKIAPSHPATETFAAAVKELFLIAKEEPFDAEAITGAVASISDFGYGGYARYLTLTNDVLEQRRSEAQPISLTPSETAILRALAEGQTPKDIASEMGRSVLTVQTHIQNIIKKVGGHGRSDAIAAARRMGLL